MTNEEEPLTRYSAPARHILHPTDFSSESRLAFAHALRLALTNHADLSLLHVGEGGEEEWDKFPAVRETLQRWGLLEPGAKRGDVPKLGIGVEKVLAPQGDVVDAISGFFYERPIDLLVLATHGRHGLDAWLHPSLAQRVARKTRVPTLFVPVDCRSCVSPDDGTVTMDRVVVPIDRQPPAQEAIERGLRAIAAFGHDGSQLSLVHVGPEPDFPDIRLPSGSWPVERVSLRGEPVAEILRYADEVAANLLVMVTDGTHGFLDALRGTTTEQVLRRTPCPLLSVPAEVEASVPDDFG